MGKFAMQHRGPLSHHAGALAGAFQLADMLCQTLRPKLPDVQTLIAMQATLDGLQRADAAAAQEADKVTANDDNTLMMWQTSFNNLNDFGRTEPTGSMHHVILTSEDCFLHKFSQFMIAVAPLLTANMSLVRPCPL